MLLGGFAEKILDGFSWISGKRPFHSHHPHFQCRLAILTVPIQFHVIWKYAFPTQHFLFHFDLSSPLSQTFSYLFHFSVSLPSPTTFSFFVKFAVVQNKPRAVAVSKVD